MSKYIPLNGNSPKSLRFPRLLPLFAAGALQRLYSVVISTLMIAGISMFVLPASLAQAADNIVTVADIDCGPNDSDNAPPCIDDISNQRDVSQMGSDAGHLGETDPYLTVFWSLDETTTNSDVFSCATLDTNGDGFTSYSLCVRLVQGAGDVFELAPAQPIVAGTEQEAAISLWRCGDGEPNPKKGQRCDDDKDPLAQDWNGDGILDNDAGDAPHSTCVLNLATADPFAGQHDGDSGNTTLDAGITCTIYLEDLEPAQTSMTLLNVCAHPTSSVSSDPSDCIIPGDPSPSYIQVLKVIEGTTDDSAFNFTLDGQTFATIDTAVQSMSAEILVTPGDHVLAEVSDPAWELTASTCDDDNTSRILEDVDPATLSVGVGQLWVCTFTNTLAFTPAPAIDLFKSFSGNNDADGSGGVSEGDTLTYSFVVTNIGNVNLTSVGINDPLPGLSSISCPQDTLSADLDGEEPFNGESITCTATYLVTAGDVTFGSIDNEATASGTDPDNAVVEDTDTETVSIPKLSVDKVMTNNADEDNSGTISLGDTLTYTITATNDGTVNLTNVTVSDDLTGDSTSCASVAPSGTCVLTGIHVVSQADVDEGVINNTGAADSDETGEVSDPENVLVPQISVLLNAKSLLSNADEDESGTVSLNDTLTYQFIATNNGNQTLTGVTIVDPLPGLSALSCDQAQPATLAPEAALTCTATYVVTQDDVEAGVINNTATADSDQTDEVPDSEIVQVPQNAVLSNNKSLLSNADEDGSGTVSLNDTLTYQFVATNDGNVELTGVTIIDPLPGLSALSCDQLQPATLAVGASLTCTATYVVTEADVTAGMINNTATADSDQTDPVPASENVPVPNTGTVAGHVYEDTNGNGTQDAGEPDLVGVQVEITDSQGGTQTVTTDTNGDYNATVPAGDTTVDIVDATLPAGSAQIEGTDPTIVTVPVGGSGSDIDGYQPQGTLTGHVYEDTNGNGTQDSGEPDLVGVQVEITDSQGATQTVTTDANGDYSATVAAGDATVDIVDATLPAGSVQIEGTDPTTVTVPAGGSGSDIDGYQPQGTLTGHVYEDTNGNGTQDLGEPDLVGVDVEITDSQGGSQTVTTDANGDYSATVAAGDATVDIVDATLPAGSAQIEGTDPTIVTVPAGGSGSDIDGYQPQGTLTGHVYEDTNGNGTQDAGEPDLAGVDVVITDSQGNAQTVTTDANGDYSATVAAGDATIDIVEATLPANVDVQTEGTDPTTVPVPSGGSGSDIDGYQPRNPELTVDKPAPANSDNDGSGDVSEGDILTYTITATNTGNIDLNNVVVSDNLITPTGGTTPCALVAPGGTCTLIGTYEVTAADITAGSIFNTATADSDESEPAQDTEEVDVPTPSLGIMKELAGNADEDESATVSEGDTLTFRITVTNTGTANLTNVTVDDDLTGTVDALCAASLAGDEEPQASCFVDVEYVVTAADVTAGVIDNTGTGDSDQTGPETDTESVPVPNTGTVAGHVYEDTNGNGTQDAGEPDLVGVQVEITDSQGGTQTVTTDTNGDYNATVPAGDTTVDIVDATLPAGSAQIEGTDPTIVTVPVGGSGSDIDGYQPQGTLTGHVYEDTNGNGTQDSGEPDLVGVQVEITDSQGATQTVTTDANGDYSATVAAGDATVDIVDATLPAGSVQIEGTDPTTVTVPAGGSGSDIDGYQPQGTLTGHVYEDTNGNGTQDLGEPDLVGVDVEITDSQGGSQTVTTDANGDYSATVAAGDATVDIVDATLPAGSAQIEGTDPTIVTVPAGGSGSDIDGYQPQGTLTGHIFEDTNGDGTQQVGEPDLVGVDVVITDSQGGTQTVTTDANGDYSVTVPAGSTTADINENTLPAGSTQTAGADPTTVNVPAGGSASDLDGYQPQGDVFGHIFEDTNGDGIQDVGEPNLAGVDVLITDSLGGTQTVTTDANGNYSATVPAGSTTADVDESTLPAGSVQTAGSDPSNVNVPAGSNTDIGDDGYQLQGTLTGHVYEDTNGNGVQDPGEPNLPGVDVVITDSLGNTQTVTTDTNGDYSVTVPAGSTTADINENTLPAGSTQTAGADPTTVTVPAGGSASDLDGYQPQGEVFGHIFEDTNGDGIQDVGEPNLAGVDVLITDSLGGTQTVTTDANGNYSATVPVGSTTAIVDESTLPAGVDVQTAGSNPTTVNVPAASNTNIGDDGYQPRNPELSIDKVYNGFATDGDADGSGDVSLGDSLSYTITATNTGNVDLNGVVVSDDLTGDFTGDGTNLACVDPLTLTATCVLSTSYVVTAANVLAGEIVNTGTGDSDQTDPVDEGEQVDVPTPSLETDKVLTSNDDEDVSGDVSFGDTLNYTITVTNTGTANLTDVTVADDLTSASTSCALVLAADNNGGVAGTCVLSTSYVVTAANVLAGEIVNTGTGDSDQTDPVDEGEQVDVPTPSLETDKVLTSNDDEDVSGDVSEGDTLNYTITVTNTGTANLTDVTVADDLTSASTSCALVLAADNNGGVAGTCVLSTSYVVTAANVLAGEIVNTGTGDSDQTPPDPDPNTELVPTPSLETDKVLTSNDDEDVSGDVSEGDTLNYTITVTNTGTANLTDVTVADDLTSASTSCALVLAADNNGGVAGTCVLSTSYVVTAANVLAGEIVNTGTGDSDQTPPDPDPNTEPVPQPSLAIDKVYNGISDDADGSGDVSVGDTLSYTIKATNDGTANLTNVMVSDNLTGDSTSCAGPVAPGGTCVLNTTYVVMLSDIATMIANIGTADSVQTDPVTDAVNVDVPQSDLLISKNDGVTEITAGDGFYTYTITVINTPQFFGGANMTSVMVSDTWPAEFAQGTVTPSQGTCSAGPNFSCNLGTVLTGYSATITVSYTVPSSTPAGPYTNSVTVAAPQDSDTSNNSDDDTNTVVTDINLSIIKTFDPTSVPQGTAQSFTIEVSNAGPSDAVDVSVVDSVHDSLAVTGVSVTSGFGDCSASAGQQVDCTVQIPAGQSVLITVDYLTAPFSSEDSPYGTVSGDDFRFVFENGSVLEGSTDGGPVFLDGVDITADVEIVIGLTKNDIVFDPPGADPAFELHLSCSDAFTAGWGQSGGPIEGVDTNWQIAFFTIARYQNGDFRKTCGNVVNPFDVPNTATAEGEDSSGTETVSDNATLTITPGIKLDRLQTNGKRLTSRLTNFTGEDKVIEDVTVMWPDSNGDLTKVWLTFGKTSDIVWDGIDDPTSAFLDVTDPDWIGGTLLTGEAILRFDFKNKVARSGSGYTIQLNFADGTFLDINQ